ncbi:L-ascorbate oxidase [Actinidia chinensis var. chinensis]|uniref:L-ascorbate oxidase n=1 Tax=Actinidia chinensis var. chinensis TaxID=1590841 RepID=A0A2R6RL65_ACTCC|nr:L-ascorbate oxidase [Actinidia chinensis var. chinensis]
MYSNKMAWAISLNLFFGILAFVSVSLVKAEDPYRFFTWEITYGTISPLGINQRGILINGQFPGPTVYCVTNDNIIVTIINKLDEPFLITWNGIKQRKSSWQDGVLGTNCPIPPNSSWTYRMQMKDQIGTFTYFASTLMHRAAGGFGGLNVASRPMIPVPYSKPAEEFTLLVNDYWKADHKVLQQTLDSGNPFPFPDAILINGLPRSATFTGQKGQSYMFRVSNVGLTTSINFRIQGHMLTLVEVEGSHNQQEVYSSLDIHVGQSVAFLVNLNGAPKDYYIVASTRFTKPILTATGILRYAGSNTPASLPLPIAPTYHLHWSMKQARTIRWNLTANAARPNPQGSFHYGTIKIVRTIVLANSMTKINGRLRYAVNSVSYTNPDTPLKFADFLNIPGVFNLNTIKDIPPMTGLTVFGTSVIGVTLHDFVEIIFQNNEKTIQSWHLDGYDFWTVGFGNGQWNSTMRRRYNLADAPTRYTVQVYPNGWSAILVSLDNKGMWNLRSAIWPRQYLGQQLYVRVWNDEKSLFTEYDIPANALYCGKAHP